MSNSNRNRRNNTQKYNSSSKSSDNDKTDSLIGEIDKVESSSTVDSDFVKLDELVYAPLHALAESDYHLREEIIQSIKSLSQPNIKGDEQMLFLKTLNIAFEQVRANDKEKYKVDTLQVRVPLMSIVPLANLGIDESEIDFSAEVRSQENPYDNVRKFEARICSPEQRDSDFLPRVSYKIKVKSIPATEGIMRLIDSLGANQVAKLLKSNGVDEDGNPNKNITEINDLKSRVTKLKQIYSKIDEVTDDMEQMNKIKDNISTKGQNPISAKKQAILDEIIKCQDAIMKKEISCVISEETHQKN
ncbi:MAG: DUF2589 domain-containing protein [Eubacterium sp.]|nr:DUF2589 domain-containing protein [Eubacterium sp.]